MSSYQILVGSTGNNSVNKIPEYARDYKKEWLMIRGINKELESFIRIHEPEGKKFSSPKADRIKYNIKRFLRAQEKGKFKDISNLMLPRYDYSFIQEISCIIDDYEIENEDKPSYKEFLDLNREIYKKIKIEYVFSDYYGEDYYI